RRGSCRRSELRIRDALTAHSTLLRGRGMRAAELAYRRGIIDRSPPPRRGERLGEEVPSHSSLGGSNRNRHRWNQFDPIRRSAAQIRLPRPRRLPPTLSAEATETVSTLTASRPSSSPAAGHS